MNKGNTSQPHASLRQRHPTVPRSPAVQWQWSFPVLSLGETHLECWAPQHNRHMDIPERAWERATKLMDELKRVAHEERLRGLGLLSLEKAHGNFMNVDNYPRGGNKADRARLFSLVPIASCPVNWNTLKNGLNVTSCEGYWTLQQWLRRVVAESGWPEWLRSLQPWRYSKSSWTRSWATHSNFHYFEQRADLISRGQDSKPHPFCHPILTKK